MTRKLAFFALPLLGLIGGLVLGISQAATTVEADQLREQTARVSYKSAYRESFRDSRAKGRAEGRMKGLRKGSREGAKTGASAGTEAAEVELAAIAEAEAQAEAESQLICDHPTLSGCLTPDQIAYGEAAESLCGGGQYAEAAAQGIEC